MTQGSLPSLLPLGPLKRISPSQLPLFNQCKLRATWSSNHAQALLPLVPSAHLGIVIHKVLEKAERGEIVDDKSFFSGWDDCVNQEENKMSCSWIEQHLVPLEKSAIYYEVKKQQCLLMVRELASITSHSRAKTNSDKRALHEVWLQTSEGKAGGYVDAILPSSEGDVIVDYKTGVIAEPDLITSGQGIRSDYQIQMKLYAALYNSMFGKWPASIELIGLDGVSHPIFFQPEECLELLDDALELLSEVNSMISTESRSIVLRRLASPSPVACRFCLYRPCCPSYWQKRSEQEGDWPHDTRGKLKEIKKLGNILLMI